MSAEVPKFPDPDEFQDPLEDFEPKTYDDPLEKVLAEQTVEAIQSTPFTSVSPDTPISEALRKLADLEVACLLIADNGRLVGVFTDRDALDKVALEYEQVKDEPISTIMVGNPAYVYTSDSPAAVLSVMAVSGFRHVPVLDLDDHIVGIASPQRVTAFLMENLTR